MVSTGGRIWSQYPPQVGHVQLRSGDEVFLCRVAGVARHGSRVLVHRAEGDRFWSFPGGRLEIGETLEVAVRREMAEETGHDVGVVRLLWIVENFFGHQEKGSRAGPTLRHHELGFYFEIESPPQLSAVESFWSTEPTSDVRLEFRWFQVEDAGELDLRPAVLRDALADVDGPMRTLVNWDD